jgi:RNA polymerase sigma-70 factor (ECF subfamily)
MSHEVASVRLEQPIDEPSAALDFDGVYDAWFHHVERWLRALGAPSSEVEDWAQEVFVVVSRRLPDFDGRNLPAWLYRICARTASDHRRRAWFKRILWRAREEDLAAVEEPSASPVDLLEQKEERRALYRLLAKLSEKRRIAFRLFEIEGYTGEEIATMLNVPLATVRTRLHHARQDMTRLCSQMVLEEGRTS